jgi:hypothetical protein
MGKVSSFLAGVALLLAATLTPWKAAPAARAQAGAPISCSNEPLASPMQGHYTGTWQSTGDYHFHAHFDAFAGAPAQDHDIEMKLTINGTLDATVSLDGRLSGTATGSVNAPLFHDGQQDISGGIGTINGQLTGAFSSNGSLLVLTQPIIDMQWGTFGGRQVETHPVLSDFQFSVGGFDCISSQGSLSEQNFPVMNIINDSTGQVTQAPGIGSSSGNWQMASDAAATYNQLSQQLDSFLDSARTLLDDSSTVPTPSLIETRILQPLGSLETTIRQNPDVSSCLLARIGAWVASVLPGLFARVQARSGATDLASLRQAGDLLRAAELLNQDCSLPDGGAGGALLSGEQSLLDQAVTSRNWPEAMLLTREILLLQGESARASLQARVDGDLHALLATTSDAPGLLEIARLAFVLHDDVDVAAAVRRLPSTAGWEESRLTAQEGLRQKRKKHPGASPPTPTPTPTPAPKTVHQILLSGVARVHVVKTGGWPPGFSWQPVSGATRYLVTVTAMKAPFVLWTWSGSTSSVTYGDTSIEGTPNTADDAWPISLASTDYRWSVVALNGQGQIVGAKVRSR